MIGETLLQYRIVEKIGSGGMGVVYKAVDTRLEREAAIKILSEKQAADPVTQQRFLREARSASSLNHPNIVTVYEVNSDRGITFLAMEYIHGVTLSRRMKKERLEAAEILNYAVQFAEGLAKAHGQGLVHRDLKPGNLMITTDGIVKILDFGLARVSEGNASMETIQALTLAGSVMGTPGYMSPEQSLGDVADARSDIFSFGVILYEMVTGAQPFPGDTVPRILRSVVADPPRPMEALPEGLPAELKDVILRCLRKEKEQRYANAGELLRVLKGLSVSAEMRPTMVSLPVAPVAKKRSPYGIWAAAAMGVVVMGFLGWMVAGRGKAPRSAVDGNASPRELVEQGRQRFAAFYRPGYTEQAFTAFEAAVRKDPANAPAHVGLAEVYLRRNTNGRDPQWVKLAEQHAVKAVELNPALASAQVVLAQVQAEKGERKQALETLRKALDLEPRSGQAYLAMAKVQASERDAPAARASFAKALELSPENWFAQVEAGVFYFRQGDYGAAQKAWERAGVLTPDNDLVWRNLSSLYLIEDRFDDAAAAIQKALELRPTAPHFSNLGYIRFFQGRYMDAIPPFEKAVELAPSRYLYWGNLGDAYRWTAGKEEKAKEAFATALRLVREAIASAPKDVEMRASAAVYLAKSGEKKQSLEEVKAVEKLGELGPGARFKLALASEIAGNRDGALRLLESALGAGYSLREVKSEPEFTALRKDVRYQRLLTRLPAGEK
ncbi:MAG: protein kinase [Acidobacteria bacterium]|nr:protein kinase [Acidobacteriota bacterium]